MCPCALSRLKQQMLCKIKGGGGGIDKNLNAFPSLPESKSTAVLELLGEGRHLNASPSLFKLCSCCSVTQEGRGEALQQL